MGATISYGVNAAQAVAEGKLEGEINGLAQTELSKIGLEGVPVNIQIDDISPEGVRDAAINAGIGYADVLLQKKTGLPIRLPRKLSVDELGRSLGYAIPTDAQSAVDLALTLGGQAIAQGVTTLLIAAGAGSVVPGLGTIVGIGVALGINALGIEVIEKKGVKLCTNVDVCPKINLDGTKIAGSWWVSQTPLSLLVEGLSIHSTVSRVYAEMQARSYCSGGPTGTCRSHWATIVRNAAAASVGTAKYMQWNETHRVLAALNAAPTGYASYDPVRREIVAAYYENFAPYRNIGVIKRQLGERIAVLRQLQTDLNAFRLGRMVDPAALNSLRMRLLEEVDSAARQVQGTAGQPAVQAENLKALDVAVRSFQQVNTTYATTATAPKPVAEPTDPMFLAAKKVAPILSGCTKLYADWAAVDPRSLCVDGATKSALVGLCIQAGNGSITLEQMTAQADVLVNAACRRQRGRDWWAALRGGFRTGLDPSRVLRRA